MPILDEKGFIKELLPHEIIVVGTNSEGLHHGGAAAQAHRDFGLAWGVAVGLSGQTYAFLTMDGLDAIEASVAGFYQDALAMPEKTFHVTTLGCGIAGHKPEQVAPFFADPPKNVILPPEFLYVLKGEAA